RALSLAGISRILRREILGRHRRLFSEGAGAGLEGGTLLLVDDLDAAQIPRRGRIRRAHSACRAGICRQLEGSLGVAVGELCGAAVLGSFVDGVTGRPKQPLARYGAI